VFGSTEADNQKRKILEESAQEGLATEADYAVNTGIRYFQLTEAGRAWIVERSCFP
jgi:predicted type IV restriction endonuclease